MDETLSEIFRDIFNARLEQLHDSLPLRDLEEWDSLAHMQLIAAVESAFSIELTGDEIAAMETVEHVKRLIRQKGPSKA